MTPLITPPTMKPAFEEILLALVAAGEVVPSSELASPMEIPSGSGTVGGERVGVCFGASSDARRGAKGTEALSARLDDSGEIGIGITAPGEVVLTEVVSVVLELCVGTTNGCSIVALNFPVRAAGEGVACAGLEVLEAAGEANGGLDARSTPFDAFAEEGVDGVERVDLMDVGAGVCVLVWFPRSLQARTADAALCRPSRSPPMESPFGAPTVH